MTYQEANNISIKDYLESLGILPVVDKLYYGMYRSPLRQDNTPSFKVDYGVNLWCDFGTGEGGSLIDLVMKQYGCNAYGAISRLEQGYYATNTFSFQGKGISERNPAKEERKQPANPIEIRKIQPLQNPALINYLKSRNISPEVAADYVQEMYYRVNGKSLFALAFKNNAGGYELRNPGYKGSISPKDITRIQFADKKNDSCFVLEGFMDYLSFLTIRHKNSPTYPCIDWQDYIILNSTANVNKALYPLGEYEKIHCLLDNDEAGRKAVEAIQKEYGWRVRDSSHLYTEHKDLNDYLCKMFSQPAEKMQQPEKQTQSVKHQQPEEKNRQSPGEKRKKGRRL